LTSGSHDRKYQIDNLYIYGALLAGSFFLSVTAATVLISALLNCSKHLHDSMMSAVLKAPVLFFDTNPVGRIINRFSRDIGIMDELLPDEFLQAVQIILFCVGAVVLPSVLNPWIILPATPLMALFMWFGRYYLRTSRDLRRLEGMNRSPVLSHFNDTLEGLVAIRVNKKENKFLKALYRFGFYRLFDKVESLINASLSIFGYLLMKWQNLMKCSTHGAHFSLCCAACIFSKLSSKIN